MWIARNKWEEMNDSISYLGEILQDRRMGPGFKETASYADNEMQWKELCICVSAHDWCLLQKEPFFQELERYVKELHRRKEERKMDQELEDMKSELKRIKDKYSDPRRDSWDPEDQKDLLREKLHMEAAIEKILGLLVAGKFTVDESKRIFSEAWNRISISTPVRDTISHQNSLTGKYVQDNHQGSH